MNAFQYLEILFTLGIGALIAVYIHDYRLRKKMPPGPPPIPFLGNKLVQSKPWIQFDEWSKIYGPIFTVWNGRRPTIVMTDPQIATDLLEKRSNIYSSRPRFVMMGDLYSENDGILVQPYGDAWRTSRKLVHQVTMPKVAATYKPVQEAEARRLLWDLHLTPQKYEYHLDRYASSTVMCASYGRRVDSADAQVIRRILDQMQYMAFLNLPGRYLAESFPFLLNLPDFLAPWKVAVKDTRNQHISFLWSLCAEVQDRLKKGTAPESYAKWLLTEHQELSQKQIARRAATLFGAGSDTTSSTLCSFVLAMEMFPEIQTKAQAELDKVVGRERLPSFTDQANLPYINALVKETLRWRPVAVLGGTPHANVQDDYYDGYLIPKDTVCLASLWSINLNPKYYPDPHNFDPQRFLDPSAPDYPSEEGHQSFGWGRRKCPGATVALQSLYNVISKLLWAYTIQKGIGSDGKEVIPDTFNYTDGFNSRPHPFPARFTPRSERTLRYLEEQAKEAMTTLSKFEPFD